MEKREMINNTLYHLVSTSFILVMCLFSIVQLLLSLTIARTMTHDSVVSLVLCSTFTSVSILNLIFHPLAFYTEFKIQ